MENANKIMCRFLISVTIGAILLGVSVYLSVLIWPGMPKCENMPVDATTHDFGDVDNTKIVTHEFKVKNSGDSPLRIDRIFSSCGCTLAEMSNNSLGPDSQAVLRTSMNLHGRKGHLKKFLLLYCNDPRQPSVQLWLRANAVEHIQVQPNIVLLGQLTDNSVVSKVVTLRSKSPSCTFNIKNIRCDSPKLQITANTVVKGREYRIHIQTCPPIPQGKFYSRVQILTDNPQHEQLLIKVKGTVPRELVISPTKIEVKDVGDCDADSRETFIFVGPGKTKKFNIISVNAPYASIDTKVIDLKKHGYAIRLKSLPPPTALKDKTLQIVTDVAGMKNIILPFLIVGNYTE